MFATDAQNAAVHRRTCAAIQKQKTHNLTGQQGASDEKKLS